MNSHFTKNTFRIVKCTACKLMGVENIPEDLSKYYSKGYFTGDVSLDGYMNYDLEKELTKKSYERQLDIIEKYLSRKSDIDLFEIGCATGFFMSLAEERGLNVEGIDISEYAVSKAIEKGLSVCATTFESYETKNKFDVVVMQDVIEHVASPVDYIIKSRNVLREGGLIAFTTPDSGSFWAKFWGKKWHAFVPPQHLFYFSSKNLSCIIESNGFNVVYSGHHGKRFSIPYIVRLLYSWTGLKVFSKLAEWSTKSFLKNISLPINLYDTLFIIAKKSK